MIVYLPLLIALVGLVVFALATNPKASEVGRIMLWVGLLAFLVTGSTHLVSVLK